MENFSHLSALIIEDDLSVSKALQTVARKFHLTCYERKNGKTALEFLKNNPVNLVILDLYLEDVHGFEILALIHSHFPHIEVIVITGHAKIKDAVNALKNGAFDYLSKPFESIEALEHTILAALQKIQLQQEKTLFDRTDFSADKQGLIGKSQVMQPIYRMIREISPSEASVLILGESGTGKEVVAKAIHQASGRRAKPFVVINCSAIPETLMESELFGHMRGSFTGATQDKKGLFEEAGGGTVFLDEIGEIPLSIQVKLLRVLQAREIKRIGEEQMRPIDVRIIAATHRNLLERMQQGEFREDLYYRLNVVSLTLPPLRDRKEDIPLLAYHFAKRFAAKMKKDIREISVEALQLLQNYAWLGNVRELENVIERAIVLSDSHTLEPHHLPPKLLKEGFLLNSEIKQLSECAYQEAKQKALDLFNKKYLIDLLKRFKGNISLASEKAGMDRSNFKKILKKYEVAIKETKAIQ